MDTDLKDKQPTYEELATRAKVLEEELQQRTQTETQLRELGEQYKLIFDKARDAIFVIQDDVINLPIAGHGPYWAIRMKNCQPPPSLNSFILKIESW